MKDSLATSELELKQIYPFDLDAFQKEAIAALNAGKSVVVCAPTGSGKTLIGEYAIYRAINRGKRVFYTTPLKALSNQKFRDFQERFDPTQENHEVGLITGDSSINPNASVVVMTTEIFRNMLYETPIGQVGTSLEDVETVVLDECHYISDKGRGTVWEESIIYCPPQIQLVALSATIGNPEELTEWINQVRIRAAKDNRQKNIYVCELINSNHRPVPLQYHFINKKGLFPLLNEAQNKLNPRLKDKSNRQNRRKFAGEDCPKLIEIINCLREKDMLPAIYVIFSRRGCDRAVAELNSLTLVNKKESWELQQKLLEFFLLDNLDLQQKLLEFVAQDEPDLHAKLLSFLADNPNAQGELLQFLAENLNAKSKLIQFLAENSEAARAEQVEPLMRGIAAHHAGMLPAWKELGEKLFELGLVKVIFATATLSAGINMPARTTVISALSKRSDEGHRLLTPSEFLQIAGRAGRRGKDSVGHVITLQTPFEGAKEGAYLATASPEPLRSWFTPSYGMVLNLLQKYTIEEAKNLLERSFAEFLAQLRLGPEQQTIASITTELAKIDVELATIDVEQFASYEKLKERHKEENRLLEILEKQAEASRRQEIVPLIPQIEPGRIIYLKGKHVQVSPALAAVLVTKIPGSGQLPDLVCLGLDNRWYIVPNREVIDINDASLPASELEKLSLPDLENVQLGRWRKGNEISAAVCDLIPQYATTIKIAAEVVEQQHKVDAVQINIENHPLQRWNNPGYLIKRHKHRLALREQLHKSQVKYQKQKSHKSYYWEEFLNLIEVLREFEAISGFKPTLLGEASAAIRGENELWLGLVLMSGELDFLAPHHLGAAISALITETPRSDTNCDYQPSLEVLEALGLKKRDSSGENHLETSSLWETRRQLNQSQNRYGIVMPVWLERKFIGLVEQWALGTVEWNELCIHTSLDEGDIVRMLRRTVDILWQIPQVPGVSKTLKTNARSAVAQMKRFPV